MPDQAAELRGLVQRLRWIDKRESPARPGTDGARIIATTSGKGGVGKTNFVVNTAISMAGLGLKVSVLDADLGMANVDVLLGLAARYNLRHVINGTLSMSDIIVQGPRDIQVIPGASGLREIADLRERDRLRLIGSLEEAASERDILFIDTGAGVSSNVLDFVMAAGEVIVLTTPEPTAMTDAYAMIKLISRQDPRARIHVVVNMAPSRQEAQAAVEQLNKLCQRFLGFRFNALGYIPMDPVVSKSVKQRQPFVVSNPYSPATAAIDAIARDLKGLPPADHEPGVRAFVRRLLSVSSDDYLL